MKIAVIIAILFFCFHGNDSQSLSVTEGSFIIEGLDSLVIDIYPRTIRFSLHLYNNVNYDVTSYDIELYLSNDEKLSLTSREFPIDGVEVPLTLPPKNNDGSELQLDDLTADVSADAKNCDFYYYLCVKVGYGSHSCINVRDSFSCPGIYIKKMKILNPAPAMIKYSTTAYTDITFSIECERYRYLDLVGVKLYFTNGDDMSKNTTTYEGDAIEVTGMTFVGYSTEDDYTMQPLYASPKVDVTNCAHYTHLCALVFPEARRGVDKCIPLGTSDGDAGSIVCPEEKNEDCKELAASVNSSECCIYGNNLTLAILAMMAILTIVIV